MVKTLVACGDYPEDEGDKETTAELKSKPSKKYYAKTVEAGDTYVLKLPTGHKVVINANESGLYADVELCERDFTTIESHTVYKKGELI